MIKAVQSNYLIKEKQIVKTNSSMHEKGKIETIKQNVKSSIIFARFHEIKQNILKIC